MISRLVGTVAEKDLRSAVIDVGGVGYEVHMPLGELSRLPALGAQVTLRIYTHVREDLLQLFGFLADDSKAAFVTLLSVNGVGPKMALGILSGIEPGELAQAVEGKDLTRLTAIPGVGRKTAERLCLELQGKLGKAGALVSGAAGGGTRKTLADLASALVNLGYKAAQVDKVCGALEPEAKAGEPMDRLIREALKRLSQGSVS